MNRKAMDLFDMDGTPDRQHDRRVGEPRWRCCAGRPRAEADLHHPAEHGDGRRRAVPHPGECAPKAGGLLRRDAVGHCGAVRA